MPASQIKTQEYSRVFESVPSVLIQHPSQTCAYLIPSTKLAKHRASAGDFARLRPGTVTFSIGGDELVDDLPAFNQDPDDHPDVLIRFTPDRTAYLLKYGDLESYKVAQPDMSPGEDFVSFIIPAGMELIEEIPLLKRGLLQSNTG